MMLMGIRPWLGLLEVLRMVWLFLCWGGHSIQILYLLKRNVFLEIYFRQLLDFLNREKLNIELTCSRIIPKIRVN